MTRVRSRPIPPQHFDASIALEKLAREQGIKPINDVGEMANLWPKDDDPDLFLSFLLSHRAERRAAAAARAGDKQA